MDCVVDFYVDLVMCFVFVLFLDFFGIWYRVGAMR